MSRATRSDADATAEARADHERGAGFWVGLVVGGILMAYGVRGVLMDLGPGNPRKLATWVVGLDLVHDLLVAPVLVVVGLAISRALPRAASGPVRAATALSAIVVVFSIPL